MKSLSDIDLNNNRIGSGYIKLKGVKYPDSTEDYLKGVPQSFPEFRLIKKFKSKLSINALNSDIKASVSFQSNFFLQYTEGLDYNNYYVGLRFKKNIHHGQRGFHCIKNLLSRCGQGSLNGLTGSIIVPNFSYTYEIHHMWPQSANSLRPDWKGWIDSTTNSKIYLSGDLTRFVYSKPVRIGLYYAYKPSGEDPELVYESHNFRLIYTGLVHKNSETQYTPDNEVYCYLTDSGGLHRNQM